MAEDKLTNFYTGWRYNPDQEHVARRLDFLQESHYWPREKLDDFQWQDTRRIIEIAYGRTEYYRALFSDLKITPQDIRSFDDLLGIPLLDKETIKSNYDAFIVDGVNKDDLLKITSGGSTGNPLTVYHDEAFNIRNRANTFYYLSIFGHNPYESRSVRMHGDPIPPELISDGSYSFKVGDNKLILSSQHISESTIRKYVDLIREFKPQYLHAYPSAVYALCSLMQDAGLDLGLELECVYCDSEMLYPGQKSLIEKVLNCEVHQTYGHTESATLAVSMPGCSSLHVLPQVGYTEIIKENGQRAYLPGETGEIVATGFHNEVFPLIRYRTFDIATIAMPCPGCACSYQVLESIQGRTQDYAVGRDGTRVPAAPGLFDYNIDWSGVRRFQVVQNKAGHLDVFIEMEKDAGVSFEELSARLSMHLDNVFGDHFSLNIIQAMEIDRTGRGKFRYFIQNI